MNVKILLSILSLIAIFISGCNGGGSLNTKTASLKNAQDSASYYFGFSQGAGLASVGIDINHEAYLAGLNTGLSGEELDDPEAVNLFMRNFIEKSQQRIAEENLRKGKEFLENNAKKSGVDTLANGIQYKVERMGDGPKPEATDKVKLHYTGTLLNGKKFDSSYDRGDEPVEFIVNRNIPGFAQALQAMPVGSKWTVYIPSDQAYGARGGGPIGQNETLIFEIELFEIVAPETQE